MVLIGIAVLLEIEGFCCCDLAVGLRVEGVLSVVVQEGDWLVVHGLVLVQILI